MALHLAWAALWLLLGIASLEFLLAAYGKYRHLDSAAYGMFMMRRSWLWMHLAGGLTTVLLGPIAIDAKRKARMEADWQRLAAETSYLPFAALVSGRTRLRFGELGWWRIGLGLALYAVLLWAHPWLFGVSPLPF